MALLTRRTALTGGLTGGLAGSGLLLAGCSQAVQADRLTGLQGVPACAGLRAGHGPCTPSASCCAAARSHGNTRRPDISRHFKANGTVNPDYPAYNQAVADRFASWRLVIDGMVARPLSLGLAELKRLPARTQITRHGLRGGLERHRRLDGRAARPAAEGRGRAAGREVRGVLLRRQPGRRARQGRRAGPRPVLREPRPGRRRPPPRRSSPTP